MEQKELEAEELEEQDPVLNRREKRRQFLLDNYKDIFKIVLIVALVVFVIADYNNLSNTEYTNDEGWQQILNDLEDAFAVLGFVGESANGHFPFQRLALLGARGGAKNGQQREDCN